MPSINSLPANRLFTGKERKEAKSKLAGNKMAGNNMAFTGQKTDIQKVISLRCNLAPDF